MADPTRGGPRIAEAENPCTPTTVSTINCWLMAPRSDVQAIESNPAALRRPSMFATADRTQNLVFPITIAPDATVMNADGVLTPLSPSTAVTADIKTGSRRIIAFVFSPLVEISSRAFGER